MNRFVTSQFEMILKRDYGFNPKVKDTPEGLKFTITVENPKLRKFMTKLTYPRTVGVEKRIDRDTGNAYMVDIVKNIEFIHTANIMDPKCVDLSFCLDAEGDSAAIKMNVIEHGLRVFMANNPNSGSGI